MRPPTLETIIPLITVGRLAGPNYQQISATSYGQRARARRIRRRIHALIRVLMSPINSQLQAASNGPATCVCVCVRALVTTRGRYFTLGSAGRGRAPRRWLRYEAWVNL